jgi:cytochrome c oxidase cbb3-type subunit 2
MLKKHEKLEKNSILMLICIIIAVSIGGLVQIIPLFRVETTIEKVSGMRPLSPLEQIGQDIYIREGCSLCHSQQIRPLRDEVERYGHYSLAAESMYDHPFLWGSKRTGPDLSRVGGKYSDEWQMAHLKDPRSVVPESIMPRYGFLMTRGVEFENISQKLKTLRSVGVPYSDEQIKNAYNDLMAQARSDGDSSGLESRYPKINVRDFDGQKEFVSEMDALVAYLQTRGSFVDFKNYNPDFKQGSDNQKDKK